MGPRNLRNEDFGGTGIFWGLKMRGPQIGDHKRWRDDNLRNENWRTDNFVGHNLWEHKSWGPQMWAYWDVELARHRRARTFGGHKIRRALIWDIRTDLRNENLWVWDILVRGGTILCRWGTNLHNIRTSQERMTSEARNISCDVRLHHTILGRTRHIMDQIWANSEDLGHHTGRMNENKKELTGRTMINHHAPHRHNKITGRTK